MAVWLFSGMYHNFQCLSSCYELRLNIIGTLHEHHGISNHGELNGCPGQWHCLFKSLLRLMTKKSSKLCITIMREIPGDLTWMGDHGFPSQRLSNVKVFPCPDVIMNTGLRFKCVRCVGLSVLYLALRRIGSVMVRGRWIGNCLTLDSFS